MKLKELKVIIDRTLKFPNMGDSEVCIPNNGAGMVQTPNTKVKEVRSGFDWDRGLFFIIPENKMKETS